uniref:Uncharacterized protein n=1 Tax=Arundo donax TaxID=35708 RepID=A0A0A9G5H4_ARUDO
MFSLCNTKSSVVMFSFFLASFAYFTLTVVFSLS